MKDKCNYPGCNSKVKYTNTLEIINEKNTFVEMPLCEYHFYTTMGGQFKAEVYSKSTKKEFKIVGPFKDVELIEQVLAARELTKLQSDKKDLSKE